MTMFASIWTDLCSSTTFWMIFIFLAVCGWGLIQAAKSSVGQAAGKGLLWYWFSGR
jgi:hypothetical protein